MPFLWNSILVYVRRPETLKFLYITNAPLDMDRLFLPVVIHHSLTKLLVRCVSVYSVY